MELGLTWPLQRFLKMRPGYGLPEPDVSCWDLHRITLRGRDCLLLVHSLSRYLCLRYDLSPEEWKDLLATVREEIGLGLEEAGLSEKEREAYFHRAGPFVCTRTHGRRPVAYLNRAWEDVLAAEPLLTAEPGHQSLLCRMVNHQNARAACAPKGGRPRDQLLHCLGYGPGGEGSFPKGEV